MTALQPQLDPIGKPVDAGTDQESSRPKGKANYVTGIADGNLATPVKLRDFLFGLGVVYRLPKKLRKAKEQAEEKKSRFSIAIPVLPIRQLAIGLAPLALAAAGYLGYQRFSGIPMPTELVGTWSTNDGRYKGRNFWLNAEAVAFQNGASNTQFSVHQIKKVKAHQAADTLFLNIDYESDGKPVTLSLAYRDHPKPEVRLINQPKIQWLRTGNAPVVQ